MKLSTALRGVRRAAAPTAGEGAGSHTKVRLKPFVDPVYYLSHHADARDSELAPLAHFREIGHAEGRVPCSELSPLAGALARRAQVSDTPLSDILELLPGGTRKQLLKPEFWDVLRSLTHPEFYSSQLTEPRALSIDEALEDFLAHGAFAGLRLSLLHHPEWYASVVERETGESIPPGCNPFFHWTTIGRRRELVPTPLYDNDYYVARHPDLRRFRAWAFTHYWRHGAFERGRRPSTYVQPNVVDHPQAKDEQRPYLLDQVREGATAHELRTSSPLEDRAIAVAQKVTRLQSPVMQEMIEKAYQIEPLIRRPYGPREVNWPPLLNSAVRLRDRAEAARARIGVTHVDTIVFVPHCRMAGSARVTGALVQALNDLAPDESLLVVTTDLEAFERPDWFPPDVQVVDTSSLGEGLSEEYRTRLLLDVVRGMQPRRVINVNSRRCWELFRMFGKQLRTMTELHAYLFTWDLDQEGNKGGYPITYFQECLGHLERVLIDSQALYDELVWRYALAGPLRDRLRVVHTPADYPDQLDHSGVFERRRLQHQPLRAFWSGRYDRQKRFDVVVEIARQLPELEILAWGKAVLGGADVDFDALPPNVRLQGTYEHFDDLPVADCDFFLYTSEWDGLPTILIDAGARGVATVASRVGGVGDLITTESGYPVTDALDPEAYTTTIRQMIAEPSEVTGRAARLRAHVRDLCDARRYAADVGLALGVPAEPLPSEVRT